jgi:hypothetical protein
MGEARALAVCDVDFKRGQLLVRHALSADEVMPPKSGHERVVPLAPELRTVLEGAVRLRMPLARIIVNERGQTPTRQRVLGAFKRLEQQLGVREWSFHSLRHYFCSALVRRGGSASKRCVSSPGTPSSTSRNATCTRRATSGPRSPGSRVTWGETVSPSPVEATVSLSFLVERVGEAGFEPATTSTQRRPWGATQEDAWL